MLENTQPNRHLLTAMYCSAVDRDVRVAYVPDLAPDPHIPLPDLDFICMEIGERCTGRLCPLDAKPAES
jgi:hypothetical protein